jgi:hypothetical protein
VGRIPKEYAPVARLGLGQPGLQFLGLEGVLRSDIGCSRNLADLARFHPQRLQELSHLGRAALESRQVLNPLRCFRDTRGRALAKSLRDEAAVVR